MGQRFLPSLPERLLPFFSARARDLPWRTCRTPYSVLVSEIMLQQTRVDTVIAYFKCFMAALPEVKDLAEAPEAELLKLWEGLGYYRRVRNLQKAALMIMRDFGGKFPASEEELRKLPGVGAYTAGAIASIAFGLPCPAVDGNVLRVLSRLTASVWTAEDAAAALKKQYPAGHCGEFTESLMELGATVCMPNGGPHCAECPVRDLCASAGGAWRNWPPKPEKKARRVEELTVYLLRHNGRIACRRRPDSGLLAGLWELPNEPGFLPESAAAKFGTLSGVRHGKHIFTHIEWHMQIFVIDVPEEVPGFTWCVPGELPLPTAFRKNLIPHLKKSK